MRSYVLAKGNSSKAKEIRGSSTRQKDNCSCVSWFFFSVCTGTASVAHCKLSPSPAQQHYRITSKAIIRNHHGLGKILCLSLGLGESYNCLLKQTREIWAGDSAVGAATRVFAQRPPELCPIQLHSRARGGLFSWRRDRCQNTGGSGEECFVVCQNEFEFLRACLPLVKSVISVVLKSSSILSHMD